MSSPGSSKPIKPGSTEVDPPRAPTERPGRQGGRRDANRKARTTAIARAALSLFLAKGLEAVTIDEIASTAGVAKGSFYTYFQDKTDLVRALLEPVHSELETVLERCESALRAATTREALMLAYTSMALGCSLTVLGHPDVARLYLQECRAPAVGARVPFIKLASMLYDRGERVTEAAHAHGLLRPLDPRVTATAVIGAAQELLHRALSNDDIGPPEAVPAALVTMVVDGLVQRENSQP